MDLSQWNDRRSKAYEYIRDTLQANSDVLEYVNKTVSLEDAFGDLLRSTEDYLEEHRKDTEGLNMPPAPWPEGTKPPAASFAVRKSAGRLIKALHSYDEFLTRFRGKGIVQREDFEMLDRLRNYVEHGLPEIHMHYTPREQSPEAMWSLILNLAAALSDIETAGKLMKWPEFEELMELPQCKDGVIDLTDAFESISSTAIIEHPGISWNISLRLREKMQSLLDVADVAANSDADISEVENIIQLYAAEVKIREQLIDENSQMLLRIPHKPTP